MKNRTTIREISIAFAAVILGVILSYIFLNSPTPIASAECKPLKGDVPLTVTCTNTSQYADNIVWNFGNSKTIKNQDEVKHTYQEPGEYEITISAHDKGSHKYTIRVTVTKPQNPLDLPEPIKVGIMGFSKEEIITRTTTHKINVVRDKHPNPFKSSSEIYTREFPVDPGFIATKVNYLPEHSNHADIFTPEILDKGKKVSFQFKLTSGPTFDTWRGWTRGSLRVVEEKKIPSKEIDLGDFDLKEAGEYPVKTQINLDSLRSIRFTEQGQIGKEQSPNTAFITKGSILQLQEKEGHLFVRVMKSSQGN